MNSTDPQQAQTTLSLKHLIVVFCVVGVWGSNFVVMKNTVEVIPPLMLATLRFFFTLFPALLFIKRPRVNVFNLMGYGVSIGVIQFGVLYEAINGHITPGLASLVVQSQAFFTVGFSIYFTGERVQRVQWYALILGLLGMAIIVFHADAETSELGLLMTILASLGWSFGNMFSKRAHGVQMLSYVVWSSAFSVPILLMLSIYVEGAESFESHLAALNWQSWSAVLWQSWANSLFGYGVWGWMLARYSAATISPFSLLVPIFGMASSALWLGESLPAWKIIAAVIIVLAMLLNYLGDRLFNFSKSQMLGKG